MKSTSKFMTTAVISVLSLGFVLTMSGCGWYHRPGETSAERARRHDRILKTNVTLMADDIDHILHLDENSRMTEKRVP